MKKYIKLVVMAFLVVVLLFSSGLGYYIYRINNNDSETYSSVKKSIVSLHKEYVKDSHDIKIIDEFNYENNKVLLFSYNELSGYATFVKGEDNKFEIRFVETFNKKNKRQVSKAT